MLLEIIPAPGAGPSINPEDWLGAGTAEPACFAWQIRLCPHRSRTIFAVFLPYVA